MGDPHKGDCFAPPRVVTWLGTAAGAEVRTAKMSSEETPFIPGKPASSTPEFEEPQQPQGPPEPKPDQSGPRPTTPTGAASADGQAA